MDQIATFLGHDIRVRREFYRLPESTLQLAKVSKLLIAMEKGKHLTWGKGWMTLRSILMVKFNLNLSL